MNKSIEVKPSLVFIPGWGADHRCWRSLESQLSASFNCSHCELPFNVNRELGDWESELAEMADPIPNKSVVVAWSLGGMFATQLAARFPDKVSALILIACNPSFVEKDTWPDAMSERVFNQFCGGFKRFPEKTIRKFNLLQAQGYPADVSLDSSDGLNLKAMQTKFADLNILNESNFSHAYSLLCFLAEIDNREILFELSQPVLSIFGENDALVPSSVIDVIKKQQTLFAEGDSVLSNNAFKVDCIYQCGHAPHISHSLRVASSIFKFLDVDDARYVRDKRRIAQSFSKASQYYDGAAQLQRRVAKKLCAWSNEVGPKVLDLGCGTGYCLEFLSEREGVHTLYGLDLSESMLATAKKKLAGSSESGSWPVNVNWCLGDFEYLPFASRSMNTLISSLAIQWSDQLLQFFSEAVRVLGDEGRCIVSSLGPETLWELNKAWQVADPTHVHVNQFVDATEVMAAADKAGFEVELFSNDYEVLRYPRALDLMKDLKAIGAHNVNQGGNPGLTGKSKLNVLEMAYDTYRDDGMLPATYQVYYWVFQKRRVIN